MGREEREEEVFVDAEEEVTPRRTTRKRRSTAGSVPAASSKKLRPTITRAMPTERSPGSTRGSRRASTAGVEVEAQPRPIDTGGDFWKKMGALLQGVESRMKEETGRVVEEKMGLAFTRIDDLSERLSSTERAVEGFMGDIGEIVGKKVEEHLQSRNVEQPPDSGSTGQVLSYAGAVKSPRSGPSPKTRTPGDEYWRCRHSLRMRPIAGDDVILEVKKYIGEFLGQDKKFIDDLGQIHVQRIPSGPAAKIKNEVIVTFSSIDARDAVKGAARNLARRGQDYGIRHEVPNHLKSDMKALHSMSYHIKQKHAEARRNVLFDDETMALVLDVCLKEGGQWRRITADQARNRSKKNVGDRRLALDDEELDDLLSSPH